MRTLHERGAVTVSEATSRAERNAYDHLIMVRLHLEAIAHFVEQDGGVLFNPRSMVGLRHAFVDIRMVIEELMLLSVSAHKDAGESVSKRLRNEYQAVNKMALLRSINARFFPEAIDVVPTDEPGISGQFVQVEDAYLTEEDAKSFYAKCGDSLHASWKMPTTEGFQADLKLVTRFLGLCSRLLKTFELDISGQGYMMLGHLNLGTEDGPSLYFTQTKPGPVTIDTLEAHPNGS